MSCQKGKVQISSKRLLTNCVGHLSPAIVQTGADRLKMNSKKIYLSFYHTLYTPAKHDIDTVNLIICYCNVKRIKCEDFYNIKIKDPIASEYKK